MNEPDVGNEGSKSPIDAGTRDWGTLFVALHPKVFWVHEDWQDDIDDAIDFETETISRIRPLAGHTTLLVGLDGGAVFHTDEGRAVDDARAEALSHWVAEREEVGEVWDEDEFEFDGDGASADRLPDGVYVVGRACAMRLAQSLAITAPKEFATDDLTALEAQWEPTDTAAAWASTLLELFEA
jgi:hypothetical protein